MSAKIWVVRRHFTGLRKPLALGVLRMWPASRMAAWSLLATLTRSPRFQAGREGWMEVWRRREIWWNGY
jgi:hypothetical protein